MIVIVGLPAYRDAIDGRSCAGGLAVDIAVAARAQGATVELVGKIGEDGAGDSVVLELARGGIGHAALVRDPSRPTPVLARVEVVEGDDAPEIEAVDSTVARLLPVEPELRPGLDSDDIDLALRYLPQAAVVVVADELSPQTIKAVAEATAFESARLVVLAAEGADLSALPVEAIALEMPADDDGSFARMVGGMAARLDSGADPQTAFADAIRAAGWERSGE
jgi:hypothetical protein